MIVLGPEHKSLERLSKSQNKVSEQNLIQQRRGEVWVSRKYGEEKKNRRERIAPTNEQQCRGSLIDYRHLEEYITNYRDVLAIN